MTTSMSKTTRKLHASPASEQRDIRGDVQLVLVEPLAELLCDPPEVADRDLAGPVVVKELERAPDLLARIAGEQMLGHCASSEGGRSVDASSRAGAVGAMKERTD